jgi:hypothetical protein
VLFEAGLEHAQTVRELVPQHVVGCHSHRHVVENLLDAVLHTTKTKRNGGSERKQEKEKREEKEIGSRVVVNLVEHSLEKLALQQQHPLLKGMQPRLVNAKELRVALDRLITKEKGEEKKRDKGRNEDGMWPALRSGFAPPPSSCACRKSSAGSASRWCG